MKTLALKKYIQKQPCIITASYTSIGTMLTTPKHLKNQLEVKLHDFKFF